MYTRRLADDAIISEIKKLRNEQELTNALLFELLKVEAYNAELIIEDNNSLFKKWPELKDNA